MNEFDEWARTNMVDDTGYIEAYGRMEQAYKAGAAAMREKCAEVADNEANGFRNTRIAAAIRKIEVE